MRLSFDYLIEILQTRVLEDQLARPYFNALPGALMILAVDVQYTEHSACVAGISFSDWAANIAEAEFITHVDEIADYQPGAFYKRELPCILQLLQQHQLVPEIIVIDGYVYLDGVSQPGLGKHLYDALNGKSTIIGVAKNAFHGISPQTQVWRGKSKKPLYVTSTAELASAKAAIVAMQGGDRMPLLLKRVDQLCRDPLVATNL